MGDGEETRALQDATSVAPSIRRDPVVDLARVACILLVVLAHLLMVGVTVDSTGRLLLSRPVEEQPWFVPVTWAGQVMPLFFALGGFTAVTSWRRRRAEGGAGTDFVRSRTMRLAAPALPLFAFVAVAASIVTLVGVDAGLRDAIVAGIGVPLWFLAAYLLVQCCVPWLAALHERAPWRTLAVLAAAAVVVDVAHARTGSREVGLVNVLFVGAFVQQLGFWYADGWFGRRTRLQLCALAVGAYGLAWVGVASGWHAANMLTNLDPPTVSLILLGIAQMSLLTVFHPALARLMASRSVRAAVSVVSARALTLYLWHMPVIVAVTALSLLVPDAASHPPDALWWAGRPLVFAVVLVVVWAVSAPLARFERFALIPPAGYRPPSATVIGVAAVLALAPLLGVILRSLDLALAAVGTLLLAASVVLDRGRPIRASTARPNRVRRARR
ncbi:acyltransferase [Agromyces sp. NPDC056523]|uniref:acyltransferase family protein n=1 Tax=Agromyces sp. NPDC056523 TaxID=3345850 RepID=UPI0036733575